MAKKTPSQALKKPSREQDIQRGKRQRKKNGAPPSTKPRIVETFMPHEYRAGRGCGEE